MDATLNWTSQCVTRHLNRAAQNENSLYFQYSEHNLYMCVTSRIQFGFFRYQPCVVGQLYISPPKNKKYCTNMCWCVTRWLAWQKNVSEEETWAKTGRSYSQARIWPTCPKTPAPAIRPVEVYFAEKVDTCSGLCTQHCLTGRRHRAPDDGWYVQIVDSTIKGFLKIRNTEL